MKKPVEVIMRQIGSRKWQSILDTFAQTGKTLAESAHEGQSPEVRARLAQVDEIARRNVEAINARMPPGLYEGLSQRANALVTSTDPMWIRLRALYEIADELMSYNNGNVACKKGCAHCCYQPVGMSKPEAQMIGHRLRIKVRDPKPRDDYRDFPLGYANPCTFLKNNECSIYEHRPFVCRTHYSVDTDALLCELHSVNKTPLLNTTQLTTFYVMITGTARSADIRDYFPPPKKDL